MIDHGGAAYLAAPRVGAVGGADDASRLRSLLDVAKVVAAARRVEDLLLLTADEARRALGADSLSISRWVRDENVIRTLVNAGALGRGEVPLPSDETYQLEEYAITSRVVRDGAGYVRNIDDDDLGAAEGELLVRLGKRQALAVPIMLEGLVWGEMWASRTADVPRFSAADLEFARAVSTQVAAGVALAEHVSRVERLAYEDPLTGIANRRAVDDLLDSAFTALYGEGRALSLIVCDVNGLKSINDRHGHDEGDRALRFIAQSLEAASRPAPGALAARLGGDEFCIVVPGHSLETVLVIAADASDRVQQDPASISISVGVASTHSLPEVPRGPKELFRLADAAQYRAKRARAVRPVLAGSANVGTADNAEDADAARALDRRSFRGAGTAAQDPARLLSTGLDALERRPSAAPPRGTREQLVAIAEALTRDLDGAGWWVSYLAPGQRLLTTVASTSIRLVTNEAALANAASDAVFHLDDYPESERCIGGAGYSTEIGAPGSDAAEERILAVAGYLGMVMAGATGPSGGWLLEIFADEIGPSVHGLDDVLRALVAVAVLGSPASEQCGVLPAARHG